MRAKNGRKDKRASLEVVLRPDASPTVRVPQSLELRQNQVGAFNEGAVCDHCASIQPVLVQLNSLVEELRNLPEEIRAAIGSTKEKEWYTTEEFGNAVDKAEWTIRNRCLQGRLNGVKVNGRGQHGEWRLSHEELLRFQREGYLDS